MVSYGTYASSVATQPRAICLALDNNGAGHIGHSMNRREMTNEPKFRLLALPEELIRLIFSYSGPRPYYVAGPLVNKALYGILSKTIKLSLSIDIWSGVGGPSVLATASAHDTSARVLCDKLRLCNTFGASCCSYGVELRFRVHPCLVIKHEKDLLEALIMPRVTERIPNRTLKVSCRTLRFFDRNPIIDTTSLHSLFSPPPLQLQLQARVLSNLIDTTRVSSLTFTTLDPELLKSIPPSLKALIRCLRFDVIRTLPIITSHDLSALCEFTNLAKLYIKGPNISQTGNARSRFLYARIFPNSLSPLIDLNLKVLHIECRIVLPPKIEPSPFLPADSDSGSEIYSTSQIWEDISKFPSLQELHTGHMLLLPPLNNSNTLFTPFMIDINSTNRGIMEDSDISKNNEVMLDLLCKSRSGLQVVRLPCYVGVEFWKRLPTYTLANTNLRCKLGSLKYLIVGIILTSYSELTEITKQILRCVPHIHHLKIYLSRLTSIANTTQTRFFDSDASDSESSSSAFSNGVDTTMIIPSESLTELLYRLDAESRITKVSLRFHGLKCNVVKLKESVQSVVKRLAVDVGDCGEGVY
ncbi:hypothetical protein SeLEV6574_g01512 [Synchytrium endobioticum]|nr:hypothetical protein SeLEV6574_g01512 [Synchytrium endobioticum]